MPNQASPTSSVFPFVMVILIALASSTGCDRNIEAYQPGEEPSSPDLSRIFPAPAGGVGSGEASGAEAIANADSGRAAREAMPPSRTQAGSSSPASAPTSGGVAPIQGKIDLAPGLAGTSPPGAILFVIARNAGARGGPPLAVLRIAEPEFPLDFSIGPENVMIPSMQFAGSISLSARLDADGNAMTRGAGDVSSPTKEPLSPGDTGVEIILSEAN